MATVRIEQPIGPGRSVKLDEFEGRLIATSTSARQPRWVEMRLYALDSEPGYALHRIGRTTVYHRTGSTCTHRPEAKDWFTGNRGDLPAGAYSCDQCEPTWPEDLSAGEEVVIEAERNRVDRCPDAASVIKRASEARHRRSKITSIVMSQPVRDLITEAVKNDPTFAANQVTEQTG